ncbi:MAG TPA: ATP-binding cassette domain-containing protein [Syntrophaceae bacterium]|nr:ATP-binding cassette domain-containing protein [Syntrophaceae bacterium]
MIEVQHLAKSYGPTVALRDVSFKVDKGEVVGFLGPNAAGKTTTMRILTCYLPADSGRVSVAGYDVFEHPLEVRKQLGYLPENTPLYLDMGVIEYLHFVAEIRHIPNGKRQARIKEIVGICGLQSVVHKDIGELSKGFRQRVGLAQALIHDPEILILDEPTIGLDPIQIIEIRELIKRIGKEKTVILSSHILPEVSATCDRVIIINEGEIVGTGTPEELATKSKGGETIYATIRGPIDVIRKRLDEESDIKDFVEVGQEQENGHQFKIQSDVGVDIREKLFFLVANNGWSLIELRRETMNLEDVFKRLTIKEQT